MKVKTYPNNLRLVVNTKKDVDVISFKIYVTAGAKDEQVNEYGYAHFLEHMFFKSTNKTSTEELLKKLEDLGTLKNAYTSMSRTCYYFKCMGSVFKQCLQIFSEMFFNDAFSKDEIEKEKSVILEEYKMGEDNPTKKCVTSAYNSMFDGTILGHDVIGTIDTIKSVTPQKLLDFKNRLYLPHNVVISVSGNVSFSHAEKLVKQYFVNNFTQNQIQPAYKPLDYLPLTIKDRYLAYQKDNMQSEIYIMYNLGELSRHKKIAFNLLFAILGYGMSSKFFETIRGKLGLVYTIASGCTKICNNFMAEIIFATSSNNVAHALHNIKQILDDCANGKILQEELVRTKNNFISNLVFDRESNGAIAENNALDLIEYSKIISEKQLIDEYMAITLEEIIDCAKDVANSKDYVVTSVGTCTKKDIEAF